MMKNDSDNIKFLRIPLYYLIFEKDIKNKKLYDSGFNRSVKNNSYSQVELYSINQALKWAVENKDYDFKSIMPDINHLTNEDIYYYLNKILSKI